MASCFSAELRDSRAVAANDRTSQVVRAIKGLHNHILAALSVIRCLHRISSNAGNSGRRVAVAFPVCGRSSAFHIIARHKRGSMPLEAVAM